MGGNGFTHAAGRWIILSTLNLHFMGAALTLTRFFERGGGTMRRRIAIAGGLTVVIAGTVAWVWRDLQAPAAGDIAEVGAFTGYLLLVLNGGALGWILWPFRIVLGPFVAADPFGFL